MSSVDHGGREHGLDARVRQPGLGQRRLDRELDGERRRAARVGRRQLDDDAAPAPLDAAQHAQVLQRQHGDLRIDDGRGNGAGARRSVAAAPGDSPPPCGEGLGVGGIPTADVLQSPPPCPSPTSCEARLRRDGGGDDRRCGRVRHAPHHVTPGWARCSTCISASRWPRCSLWRPRGRRSASSGRPGAASVASASTRSMVASQAGRIVARSTAMPFCASARSPSVHLEQLARVHPQLVERGGGAGVALLGAVAQPDHPLGRVAHMIGHLLHRLGGDLGEPRIAPTSAAPAR